MTGASAPEGGLAPFPAESMPPPSTVVRMTKT
jgi:hypothetical protein